MMSRLIEAIRERRVECMHAAAGAAIGLLFCLSSLAVDMQVRDWRGLEATLPATFNSTLMHLMALFSPLVVGRIFWSLGKRERDLRERLLRMGQTEAYMREQAHRDSLTGLYNRAHLTRALEEGIATRIWGARGALIYMLDLDDFKHVNDTFGHRAGDIVLIEVAKRLSEASAAGDIAVRLGGDEFIVVHFPSPDDVFPEVFAERLIAALTPEIPIDQTLVSPATSIGIASIGGEGTTWSEVMRAADIALYQAKLQPSSNYCLFRPEMRVERDRLALMEEEMRRGIERGEFALHYQPIYGTESGSIRSFEALVRWNHPVRGLLGPMEFIPLAESTGLIVRLGRVILKEACRAAATWPKPVGIAVNLSPVQFKDTQLLDHVKSVLAETGLAPGRLDLEVTESLLLEATHHVRQTMEGLRRLGVRITMDDFGTGFSSLSNLRAFRFDRLKIDRCFTRDIANGEDAEIVRAIVRLSKTLRMETVLEGVETEHQLAFARNEGLTEVQGFYYAKPMAAEAVDALFAARAAEPEPRGETAPAASAA